MSTIRYPITIELDREVDGRWIAAPPASPGVLAYGPSAGAAVEACLGVLAVVPDFLAWAAQVGSPPTSGMASADPLPDLCQDCGQHGPHLCPGHHPAATYDPSEEGE